MDAPNPEQLEALKRFAQQNGRYWKAVLREVWENGRYDTVCLGGADSALLQQVRNSLGPSWLIRYRASKGVTN